MSSQLLVMGVLGVLMLVVGFVVGFFLKRGTAPGSTSPETTSENPSDDCDIMRLTLEATRAGIWEYYPKEQKIYISAREQWLQMLGHVPENNALSIEELKKFIHPDDWPEYEKANREYIAGGGKGRIETEFRLRRMDGSWYYVLSKGKTVEWDKKGMPTRIVGFDLNIQSLMEAREEIRQSEKKFRAIFENAPYPISIRDMDGGCYLEANRAFLNGLGIDTKDLHRSKPEDLYSMDGKEIAEIHDELAEKGSVTNREAIIVKKDGTRTHLIFSSVLLDIQGKKRILSMAVNETERKRAEDALKESEARFRTLFKMAPLPMAHISKDGKILDVNDRLTQTMGHTIDTVPTLVHAWDQAMPDPDLRHRVTTRWRKDLEQAMADGSEMEPFECPLHYNDGTDHTVVITTRLLADSIIVGFYDITKRKKAEAARERLQAQLLQSQKMEAVGILAGGVAHDFNNMLGAIMGYTELVLSRMAPSDEHHKNLGKILDAANRSAGLTRQLLAFARKQTIAPVVFDLNQSIEAILNMVHRIIGENIELSLHPSSAPCVVRMDPSQFDQILLNLCVNAKDAISDVGRITIETGTIFLEEAYNGTHDRVDPGAYVLVSVSDDGCGMDKETLEHIFEPFFTTKGVGRGTGMGLATVYGILKQNKGAINVYSEPGKGTTFRIHLPQSTDDAEKEKAMAGAEIPRGRGETILLVEDDPILLEMSAAMLQRLGYTVLPSSTPGEAIRIAGEEKKEIDLFITDVVMPEMNGRDLADRLLSIRPGIKHLFMSGYTASIIAPRGVLDRGSNFLQKPFSSKDLAEKVREVLDA